MKPMLAVEADLSKIKYPVYAQPKLDGIRVVIKDSVVYSRSLKPIRNKYVQSLFGKDEYEGFDGELIVGEATAPDVFQKTSSGVMRTEGEPDVKLFVFDLWNTPNSFCDRLEKLCWAMMFEWDSVRLVSGEDIGSEKELMLYYNKLVEDGYEGIMVRSPTQPYKFGRSTVNSQHLLKLKPFVDAEAKVIGFTERMHNANEAKTNELGRIKRSSNKENLIPTDTLGALQLDLDGVLFECGTGFSDGQRQDIWDNRDVYIGQLAKIKYQTIGVKDKPRFPSFLGWRDTDDL